MPPRVGGRERTNIIRKPDLGLDFKTPSEQQLSGSLADGNNFRVVQGAVEKVKGWEPFAVASLNDRVMLLDVADFFSGIQRLIAVTNKKIFTFNTSTLAFDVISPADLNGSDLMSYSSTVVKDNWLLANSTDRIKKWTGSGLTADLGGLTDAEPGGIDIQSAKGVANAGEFVFLFGTTEEGTYRPLRIRWNKIGFIEIWKNDTFGNGLAGFLDVSEGADHVVNVVPLGNFWAVYKEKSVHLLSFVGAPVIWARRAIIEGRGLISPRAYVSLGDFHIVMFRDNFYIFNGASLTKIGERIRDKIYNDINPKRFDMIFGFKIEQRNEVVFAYPSGTNDTPDKAIVYNYVTNAFSQRDFPFTAAVEFLGQSATTWADGVGTWAAQTGIWFQREFLVPFPDIIVGDTAGLTFRYDKTDAKAGAAIDGFVSTALTDFRAPDNIKRVFRIKPTYTKRAGTLRVFILTADKPEDDITENGPFTLDLSLDNQFVDVDFSARYFGVKFQTLGAGEPFDIKGWGWHWTMEGDR